MRRVYIQTQGVSRNVYEIYILSILEILLAEMVFTHMNKDFCACYAMHSFYKEKEVLLNWYEPSNLVHKWFLACMSLIESHKSKFP